MDLQSYKLPLSCRSCHRILFSPRQCNPGRKRCQADSFQKELGYHYAVYCNGGRRSVLGNLRAGIPLYESARNGRRHCRGGGFCHKVFIHALGNPSLGQLCHHWAGACVLPVPQEEACAGKLYFRAADRGEENKRRFGQDHRHTGSICDGGGSYHFAGTGRITD